MSVKFEITIATPEREVYRDTCSSVTIPTVEGEITVLPHHVPLTALLKTGELIIRKDDQTMPYAVSGGFVEVLPDKLIILADTAEHIEEIDEQRAREAVERAERLKHEMSVEHMDYAGMVAKLDRDLNRLKIIKKHRSHHLPDVSNLKREE